MPSFRGAVTEDETGEAHRLLEVAVDVLGPARSATMTDAAIADAAVETQPASYLGAGHTLLSWLTTTDHKRIAVLYAISITFFFFIGGIAIALVRLELMTPQGLFLTSDAYNRLFSLHGIIMVWFFLVPSIPATMGNFLLPLMIGAHDVAFPRLNLLSWYLYVFGAAFTVYALISGGVDTGWTFYTPLSTSYATGYMWLRPRPACSWSASPRSQPA
jgi:cytochrome c oxidase subunit I